MTSTQLKPSRFYWFGKSCLVLITVFAEKNDQNYLGLCKWLQNCRRAPEQAKVIVIINDSTTVPNFKLFCRFLRLIQRKSFSN